MIKVLGIGSPFGDDAAGWWAAEALEQLMSSHEHLKDKFFIECHDRPGLRLIELMNGAECVFLIDAVQSGSKPGTLHRFENQEIKEFKVNWSTHDVGVAQALEIGYALNALPKRVILYGIEIDALSYAVEDHPIIQSAVNKVALLILDELACVLTKS